QQWTIGMRSTYLKVSSCRAPGPSFPDTKDHPRRCEYILSDDSAEVSIGHTHPRTRDFRPFVLVRDKRGSWRRLLPLEIAPYNCPYPAQRSFHPRPSTFPYKPSPRPS